MKTEVNYIHTEVSLVPTQHFSFQEFWDVRMTMRRLLITI